MSEEAVAAKVVEYLRSECWDVYQEVDLGMSRPTIDIVAKRGPLIWAVEVKKTLSLSLLAQAANHLPCANLVSVAAPSRQKGRPACEDKFLSRIWRWSGIGWISVGSDVKERIAPRLQRRVLPWISNRLREEQRTYAAAGNSQGRRWTPFQSTCEELRRLADREPGIRFRDAIEKVRHHYASNASARSSLPGLIRAGVVKGLRLEQEGRALTLWPEER